MEIVREAERCCTCMYCDVAVLVARPKRVLRVLRKLSGFGKKRRLERTAKVEVCAVATHFASVRDPPPPRAAASRAAARTGALLRAGGRHGSQDEP